MLQEARRPVRERVLEFLERNPDTAYSPGEIFVGLEGWSEMAAALALAIVTKEAPVLVPVADALRTLEAEGLIQSAQHFNVPYYAIRSP
jgi:hypothetical protein